MQTLNKCSAKSVYLSFLLSFFLQLSEDKWTHVQMNKWHCTGFAKTQLNPYAIYRYRLIRLMNIFHRRATFCILLLICRRFYCFLILASFNAILTVGKLRHLDMQTSFINLHYLLSCSSHKEILFVTKSSYELLLIIWWLWSSIR